MAKIITGYTGEPHITSDDVAAFQQGIIGIDDYALPGETELSVTTVESSRLRLSKAEIVLQGVHIRLDGTEEVTVAAQTVGTTRLDRIAVRYSKDASTNVESAELVIIQGQEAASNAVAPDLVQDDLRNGGLIREASLFLVTLKDSVIVSIVREIPVVNDLNTLTDSASTHDEQITAINRKIVAQNTIVTNNSSAIKVLQSKNDFSSAIRSVSQYAKAALSSRVASWKTNNAKPDVLEAQLAVQDASGNVKASLRLLSNGRLRMFLGSTAHNIPIIKRGTITLTPKKANEKVSKEVDFGCTFSSEPTILLTPHTTAPENVSLGTSDIGTSKFKVNLTRTSVTTTYIDWVAIGLL